MIQNRGYLAKQGLRPQVKAGLRPKAPMPGGLGKAKTGLRPQVPLGGKPPAPPAPQPASQPPVGTLDDSTYQNQLNQYRTGLNDTNLALQNQEQQIESQFGFDPQYASNPYTQANMLAKRAQQRFAGTTNSVAGRGQLYSGNTNRLRAADEFTSGAELDSARRDYLGQRGEIEAKRLAAQREFESGSANAYEDMLQRAADKDLDPSLFGGSDAPGKGGKKPSGKGSGKKPPGKFGLAPYKPKVDAAYNKPTNKAGLKAKKKK